MREVLCALLLLLGPPPGADPTMPGCLGGIAPDPRAGAIAGPGTTRSVLAAVPGGVYDLSVWAGSRAPGPATATGLRFLDPAGVQTGRTYALRASRETRRQNSYGMVAPRDAATVEFFATATTEIHWDCVFLRVSAYDLTLEAGQGTLKITVTNTGSEPLTGLKLTGCGDSPPFDLEDQVVRTCPGSAPATATVTGALYWNGALPDSSESLDLGHGVGDQPQHPGGRQLQDR
ncbi:hypothetical protein [Lentzea sp. NEAU-D7]|uniref:DUF7850 domain-containing protein n=1 Tax=Lentzea sp. NEAU-D7 TaxID=2994667 RepID=UPI00224B34CA|nr:hypothetical protein [Lentzea sp. NEAU-D7]MCX2953628.1 hypothetical protein [Lentzea sp. NEAU-D7]